MSRGVFVTCFSLCDCQEVGSMLHWTESSWGLLLLFFLLSQHSARLSSPDNIHQGRARARVARRAAGTAVGGTAEQPTPCSFIRFRVRFPPEARHGRCSTAGGGGEGSPTWASAVVSLCQRSAGHPWSLGRFTSPWDRSPVKLHCSIMLHDWNRWVNLSKAGTPVLVLAPLLPNPAASSSSFSQELKDAFQLLQQPRQKGQLAPPWSVFNSRCSAGAPFLRTWLSFPNITDLGTPHLSAPVLVGALESELVSHCFKERVWPFRPPVPAHSYSTCWEG